VLPAALATGQALAPKLSWNPVATAASYTLQVSTDSTFTTTLVYNQNALTTTAQTISGLLNSTKYYWKVIAVGTDGSSVSSSTSCFATILAAPAPTSPATDAIRQPVTIVLSWSPVASAISYALEVSTDKSFATTMYNQGGLTSTSQTVIGLSYNSGYFWRVNATNAGGTSSWSVADDFQTAPLAAPVLIGPHNDTTNLAVSSEFSWNPVSTATLYALRISTDSTFETTPAFKKDSLTDTTEIVAGLAKGTVYYWHVDATNSVGTSVWSETRSFTTVPDRNKGFCGLGSWLALIPPIGFRFVNRLKRLRRKLRPRRGASR
jgi:hypothetical protein